MVFFVVVVCFLSPPPSPPMPSIALVVNSQHSKALETYSTVSQVTKAHIHLGSAFLSCTGFVSASKPYEFEGKNTAPSYLKLAVLADILGSLLGITTAAVWGSVTSCVCYLLWAVLLRLRSTIHTNMSNAFLYLK